MGQVVMVEGLHSGGAIVIVIVSSRANSSGVCAESFHPF